jgi:hypothetical protein
MHASTFVIAAMAVAAVTAASYPASPPPPPYAAYRVVMSTETLVYTKGAVGTPGETSATVTVDVDTAAGVRCDYNAWSQGVLTNSSTLYNYTAEAKTSAHIAYATGAATKCASAPLTGAMPLSAGVTPAAAVVAQLQLAGTALRDGKKCVIYNATLKPTAAGVTTTFEYALLADSLVPFISNEKATDAATNVVTLTTVAYKTYAPLPKTGVDQQCINHASCFSDVCVATPWSSGAALQAALDWVCGHSKVNCSYLNTVGEGMYPSTVQVHSSWAFSQYYRLMKAVQEEKACYFNNAAYVVTCDTRPHTCAVDPAASPAVVASAMAWLCPKILGCSEIAPKGKDFLPNTTAAHADWAFNKYYQAYRCIPGASACGFNGAAKLTNA